MKLIYLHGFNSSENSETVLDLKKNYGNDLISISYDYVNADNGYNQINNLIENVLKSDQDLILVGSSLGGFWANYFAQKYDLKSVLINPAIKPSQSLLKYTGKIKNYTTGEEFVFNGVNAIEYKKYEVPVKIGNLRYIIIGKNDYVLNPNETIKHYFGAGLTILTNWGHRVENMQFLTNLIDDAINSYPLLED